MSIFPAFSLVMPFNDSSRCATKRGRRQQKLPLAMSPVLLQEFTTHNMLLLLIQFFLVSCLKLHKDKCWEKDIDTGLFFSISYSLPELITLEPKSCSFKLRGPISLLVPLFQVFLWLRFSPEYLPQGCLSQSSYYLLVHQRGLSQPPSSILCVQEIND